MFYQPITKQLPRTSINRVKNKLLQIREEVPYLEELPEAERESLPGFNEETYEYMCNALDYAEENPQLLPPYTNLKELREELNIARDLYNMLKAVRKIQKDLEDTTKLMGARAWYTSRIFHDTTKKAASASFPGADNMMYELNELYPGGSMSAQLAAEEAA